MKAKYNFKEVEAGKYASWLQGGYFNGEGEKSKKPAFSMVLPPPNVTGKLHLGHAWDGTIQDIIARYKRLQGFDVAWIAGMDHAGIATQAKVEAKLKAEGKSRYDLGREGFVEEVWRWKEDYASSIRHQWEKLGLSLDYSREVFTLDDKVKTAVNKSFVKLFHEGYIYKGEAIINWDVVAKTAISNIEVIHQEVEGKMYTFKYQLLDSDDFLEVATTRPETMFADVCLVVHPDDKRYQKYLGKQVINPVNKEIIPVIADGYIDTEFGTGVMKCTPAHDPNDFDISKRHQLKRPLCINEDGTMNVLAGEFQGLDRFKCRQKLVEKMESTGKVIKIEKHLHQVGHSERTGAIIEPYLSKQWFVAMQDLAKMVLDFQKQDQGVEFFPPRFEKIFTNWLENIEDWCISRQLWWGHKIPAWYHKKTHEIYVSETPPVDLENYTQDEDVLDTWFSSGLWALVTTGWLDNSADYNRYFPTSVLVTGYDIIFFWVARMVFLSEYFTQKAPFKDVLIHGLVRDSEGKKMSKSLGNGVDPLEVIDKYGIDALRFFLSTNTSPGQDLRYSDEKVEAAWNFLNKVYNAARFVKLSLEDYSGEGIDYQNLSEIEKWILEKMNRTLSSVETNLDKYELAIAGNELYHFIWDDFCSWYIEMSKVNLKEPGVLKTNTQAVLSLVLSNILIMLHPFVPYLSEEIYLNLHPESESLACAKWPEIKTLNYDVSGVKYLQDFMSVIREIRVNYNIKPAYPLKVKLDFLKEFNQQELEILNFMVKVEVVSKINDPHEVVSSLGIIIFEKSDLIDLEAEKERLNKEAQRLQGEVKRASNILSNQSFLAKAPAEKIEQEKQKLADYENQYKLVLAKIRDLD